MKNFILLCVLITPSFLLSAQQADNWYFGVFAGLNFSTSAPVVLTDGQVNTPEGCAAVSDTAGSLLFYTDGITVWNNQHLPMPNGTGLLAGSSCTQAALIAMQPGSSSLYYVFTLDEIGGPFGFRYSIVDMSLQSGLGDVIEKNILIQNSLTEKLTAVTTYDNSKIWIVTHDWGSNGFYAYQLTVNGFEMNPVISNSGIVHTTTAIQNTYGQMKFAGCGGRLALAAGYLDTIELFDFNLTTGTISNPMTIPMEDHVYGLEFSPDDSKLYVTCYNPLGTLVQFDLTQGNVEAIINSATMLSNTEDLYGLQLAPDGKIYVVKSYSPNLAVINEPNVAGNDCNFVENGINLDPTYSGVSAALGLPNFVQSYFDYAHKGCTFPTATSEIKTTAEIHFFPNPATGYVSFSTTALKGKPVEIYVSDLAGKSCIHYKMDTYDESISIDLSTVQEGIYIIRVNQGEMVIAREMLVNTRP